MINITKINIKIFLDTANLKIIKNSLKNYPFIKGFTTNPSLMHKESVKNYKKFTEEALENSSNLPISFEVFSDDLKQMEKEARIIHSWGGNSYVKIPITNTKGKSTKNVIKNLTNDGIKVNVTAIFTIKQVTDILNYFNNSTPAIISVFAGRIADTGRDPIPLMKDCLNEMKINLKSELLWASPRELLNIIQADQIGCHIITVTKDIIKKLQFINYDLEEYSFTLDKLNASEIYPKIEKIFSSTIKFSSV